MAPAQSKMSALARLMNHPAVTLAAAAFALVLGSTRAPFVQYLRPFGDFYLAFLQMCVLPFLLATIPLAVRSAMTSGTAGPVMRRLALWSLLALIAVTTTTIIVSLIVDQFFQVDEGLLARIGTFVGGSVNRIDIEFVLSPERGRLIHDVVDNGFVSLIPTNIFAALSGNDSLRVLVFSAIFGIALVVSEDPQHHSLFGSLRHVQKVCMLIFDWLGLLVPIAMIALIAPQVAVMGPEIFGILAMLLNGVIAVSVVVLLGVAVVVGLATGRSPFGALVGLVKPLTLAAATRNALVCIPAALDTMKQEFNISPAPCDLFIPLGIATLRFGTISYFMVAALFMATLFDRHLGFIDLVWLAALTSVTSFATLGASGLAALAPLATVLRSFGLSYELAVPLLIIVDPVANMIRTMVNVAVNCAIPAVVAARSPLPETLQPAAAE